jgi:formate hydrogenlyase transcriptional activator
MIPMIQPETQDQLAELKIRLAEAEGTLHAIRNAEVDAITVLTPAGERVYSLSGAEQPYREMVETMGEGAVSASSAGMVLYCNQRFADMVRSDLNRIIGANLLAYFSELDLLRTNSDGIKRATLLATDAQIPVNVATHVLPDGGFIIIVSDLTEIMAIQDTIINTNQRLEQANRMMEQRLSENAKLRKQLETKIAELQDLVDVALLKNVAPVLPVLKEYQKIEARVEALEAAARKPTAP